MSGIRGVLALFGFCAALGGGAVAIARADGAPADAEGRKAVWLASEFRCRAISSTRLRTCRIERKDGEPTLRFPVADITCTVEFGADGDPARLTECRGAWLVVPKTNALKRSKKRPVWSGSRAGWRWKSDGQEYCCPGMWLEAPKALQ